MPSDFVIQVYVSHLAGFVPQIKYFFLQAVENIDPIEGANYMHAHAKVELFAFADQNQ